MDREPNLNDNYGLQELGDSDFEIADNEPDIRGWTVKDNQGRKIGEVDELIFDPETRQVRYIVLDLEGNILDLELRDVLVPIGLAELHESDDDVILPGVSAEQLRALPLYEKGRITRDIETAVRSAFARAGATAASAGAAIERAADKVGDTLTGDHDRKRFYEHEHFDEKKLYRNRPASPDRESRITPRTTTTPTSTPSASRPDSTTMTGTAAPAASGTGTGTGLGTSGAGTMGTGTTNPSTTSGTTGTTSPGTSSGAWGTGSTGTGTPGTTGTPPSGTGTNNPPTRSTEDDDAHPHIET